MVVQKAKEYGAGKRGQTARRRPGNTIEALPDGRVVTREVQFFLTPALMARVTALEHYEDRTRSEVLRTMVWLGLGVYERIMVLLREQQGLAGTPLADPAALSPCASPVAWFTQSEIGTVACDWESRTYFERERAARAAELAAMAARTAAKVAARAQHDEGGDFAYGQSEASAWVEVPRGTKPASQT